MERHLPAGRRIWRALGFALIVALLVPAAAPAARKKHPKVAPFEWHHVHFHFETRGACYGYDPLSPPDFGDGPATCVTEFATWATSPFDDAARGEVSWNGPSPTTVHLVRQGQPWFIDGKMPSPSSDRFTVTALRMPWPHVGDFSFGDSSSVAAGQPNGPMKIDVEFSYPKFTFDIEGYIGWRGTDSPRFSCPPMPPGVVGEAYEVDCSLDGDPFPTIELTSGAMPDNMWMGAVGRVQGTPTRAGTYTATWTADNGAPPTASQKLDLTIKGKPQATVSTRQTNVLYGQALDVEGLLTVAPSHRAASGPSGTVTGTDNGADPFSVPLHGDYDSRVGLGFLPRSAGRHEIVMKYAGDRSYTPATSAPLVVDVGKMPTRTALTSFRNPTVPGRPTVFTARISVTGDDYLLPFNYLKGAVQFTVDGKPHGDPVPVVNGRADSADFDTRDVGDHEVTALYDGQTNFGDSRATINHHVDGEPTTMSIASSDNTAAYDQAVTLTARVSPVYTFEQRQASGKVQFVMDGKPLGDPVALDDGEARLGPTRSLPVGVHEVVAQYVPSGGFASSAGTLTGGQTVSEVATNVTVTSSKNPSVARENVTFGTLIEPVRGGGTARGTAVFKIDDEEVSRQTLVQGRASIDTSTLKLGHHTVQVVYVPDSTPGFMPGSDYLDHGQQVVKARADDDDEGRDAAPGDRRRPGRTSGDRANLRARGSAP